MENENRNVLILGGGFAGLESAIYLRREGFAVTLVSDRDYFFIYPTSIWIPTGGVSHDDVSIPLADLAKVHGFDVVVDAVASIDAAERSATLASGKTLAGFDYLVLAMGQGKLGHEGIEHTYSICGQPEQATRMKKRLEELVAVGEGKIAMGFGGNPKDSSAVRGGPAFELLFNVENYLKKKKLRDKFELSFFAPMAQPGKKMGEQALVAIDKMFASKGIHKKVGSKILRFEADGVVFADGTKLASDLTMFIPAGTGHSVVAESGVPLSDAGFVETSEYSEVQGFAGVYAIGDSASLMGPEWRAKQGHIAEVMARNVAHNITVDAGKSSDAKKSYVEEVSLLCVMDTGDGAAFVKRDAKGAKMVPMPVFGHWMKKGWGWYFRKSKLKKIPRIPGM